MSRLGKKFKAMFKKERAEHQTLPAKAVTQIVKDHLGEGNPTYDASGERVREMWIGFNVADMMHPEFSVIAQFALPPRQDSYMYRRGPNVDDTYVFWQLPADRANALKELFELWTKQGKVPAVRMQLMDTAPKEYTPRKADNPFKSEAQRRYLWVHHPDIARRWAHEKNPAVFDSEAEFNDWLESKGFTRTMAVPIGQGELSGRIKARPDYADVGYYKVQGKYYEVSLVSHNPAIAPKPRRLYRVWHGFKEQNTVDVDAPEARKGLKRIGKIIQIDYESDKDVHRNGRRETVYYYHVIKKHHPQLAKDSRGRLHILGNMKVLKIGIDDWDQPQQFKVPPFPRTQIVKCGRLAQIIYELPTGDTRSLKGTGEYLCAHPDAHWLYIAKPVRSNPKKNDL